MSINAEFITSSPDLEHCPPADKAEFALIGRSNVGKSSLLNLLVNRRSLAKVSHTPGKTRMLNYFLIEAIDSTPPEELVWPNSIKSKAVDPDKETQIGKTREFYLVDLPGYGYAKVSKDTRAAWSNLMKDYFQLRPNLNQIFVLIDSSIELQKIDLEMLQWLSFHQLPISIVLTKTDKTRQSQIHKLSNELTIELAKFNQNNIQIFSTSSLEKKGNQKIIEFMINNLKDFKS